MVRLRWCCLRRCPRQSGSACSATPWAMYAGAAIDGISFYLYLNLHLLILILILILIFVLILILILILIFVNLIIYFIGKEVENCKMKIGVVPAPVYVCQQHGASDRVHGLYTSIS